MVLDGFPEHDRGSVVTRRMFDCRCFSAHFHFAGLSALTCPNFASGGTRTAEAVDLVVACARKARSITIPLNALVDLITLLTLTDGNCIECSVAVAGVIQLSIATNTVVSTCGCVETPIDVSAFTRELVTTSLKAMEFTTSVTTWRPVHREARETLAGHLFPTRGDNSRFDKSTVLPTLGPCAADDGSAIFNTTEQARRLAFGR